MESIINKPIKGRTNFVKEPLGIDIEKPFFSWVLTSQTDNTYQTAYRIIVSKNEINLIKEVGDVWDTGKVASEKNSFVYYNGPPLKSFTKYYWRVKWWDNHGNESSFSDIYSFETAFVGKEMWVGKWIFVDSMVRKEFNINKVIKSARIYISALGYYELRVNGRKVGTKVLTPQWTDYRKKILYSTYDVAGELRNGLNCVGVMIGNSRYTTEYGYDGKHQVIMDILLVYNDGETVHFGTDESWKTSTGPIVYDDIYNGEIYDARLEQYGWDSPGFDDSKWAFCKYSNSKLGKLVSDALFPPIEIVGNIKPKSIIYIGENKYIVDFGQNFTGWVKIKLGYLNKGDKVKLRYAELLNNDNTLNTGPNRTAKNEDIYISKGRDNEFYEPRFTYHGFRYVEISGDNLILNLDNIEGRIVHSNVEPVGSIVFDKENDILNQIHKMVLWSQVSNLMGIPTDCPQRDERMGWLGDSSLTAEESIMNFNMYGFYIKWLSDIKDSQLDSGEIPDVVPPFWPLYPADPGWGDEYISILWDVYRYYGDKNILAEYYPYVKKWLNFLLSKIENGILTFYKYGDWCPPKMVKPLDTPGELYATSILFKDLGIMSQISKILGNNDYHDYENDMKTIKNAFNNKFLVERDETFPPFLNRQRYGIPDKLHIIYYGNHDYGTQTSQILPLYFDMAPLEIRDKIFNYLLNDVVINCSNHLNTGIFGTRYLLQVLSAFGHSETAFKVITQTSYPGWGYMLKEGATTLWERWEFLTGGPLHESEKNLAESGMNSHNHIMFGTVDNWFFDTLVGIVPDVENPGFKIFKLSPHFINEIKMIKFAFNSPIGSIHYKLETIENKKRQIHLHVPVNSKCRLELDKKEVAELISINNSKLLNNTINEQDKITYEFGSGNYEITIKLRGEKNEI
ncbi:alpha-L-rhamnosidase [Picrophilus oshimae]|uniref:alpha-L-rhamnosidase n=1 Tax=Picrophilus torridus (strain ATCC 700027 / DSM 9790 / JCM 10055 / NBRC 100828 / KAW 2/3) TaxID=1122961 RepID=A0A8G2FXM6_PICTO|nr:alpha-L-rhamnosidase [Picrophilus oshimae]SMD31412.1 alpha-L-rhamnosidase [Picrophilus oshimae DSM 9789]